MMNMGINLGADARRLFFDLKSWKPVPQVRPYLCDPTDLVSSVAWSSSSSKAELARPGGYEYEIRTESSEL